MDKALELLSFRPRSESELEARLHREDHAPDVIARALRRCRELGYLDDRAFALSHARDRLRLNPRGRRALRSELYRKGVDRDVAEAAIEEAFAELRVTERDLARQLAAKRAGALNHVELPAARRRLTSYLARRGFPGPIVRDVVGETLAAADPD